MATVAVYPALVLVTVMLMPRPTLASSLASTQAPNVDGAEAEANPEKVSSMSDEAATPPSVPLGQGEG